MSLTSMCPACTIEIMPISRHTECEKVTRVKKPQESKIINYTQIKSCRPVFVNTLVVAPQ